MSHFSLSPAERAVTNLLRQGLSNKAIAAKLILSVRTVESHVSHSLQKTGCRNRLELVLWLLDHPLQQGQELPGTVPSCRLSSAVEQRFCKAKAIGSNPLAGFIPGGLQGPKDPPPTTPRASC